MRFARPSEVCWKFWQNNVDITLYPFEIKHIFLCANLFLGNAATL